MGYDFKKSVKLDFPLKREQAIDVFLNNMDDLDAVVTTTGFLSRELYELREKT